MAFDLGALEISMRVTGGAAAKTEIEGVGNATDVAATKATKGATATKQLGDEQDAAGKKAKTAGESIAKTGDETKELGDQAASTGKKAKTAGEEIDTAGDKTRQAGDESAKATPKVKTLGDEFGNMSAATQAAWSTAGRAVLVGGAAVAAGIGLAVAKNSEYEQSVSKVVATTHVQGAELERIRDLTMKLGADSIFTATEAAQGVVELGKAGISTGAIMSGGLKGALDLAAAGEESVAEAAETAATAIVQFNLKGSDVPHVADLLAAGAGKAQGSVKDLSAALNQGGLVASQMGLSVEDTVGTLAAFAAAGLTGSDAGTSFKTMLLSLATPTKQQSDLLKQYNVHAYDQQGAFIGTTALAGQLQAGLGKATQAEKDYALGVIFGSDAIRGANVLVDQGADGMQKWTDKVNDAGYAAKFTADSQNNLRGDVEKLGGALDNALIKTGAASNGVLRDMAQWLGEVIDKYSALDPWQQQAVLTSAAVVAAILILGGTFLIAVPKLVAFRTAIQTVTTEMPKLAAAGSRVTSFLGGPWGIALAAAIAIGSAFTGMQQEAAARAKELEGTLNTQTGAITQNTRANVAAKLAEEGAFEGAKKAGVGRKQLLDAIFNEGDAYDTVSKKLTDYQVAHITSEGLVSVFGNSVTEASDAMQKERAAIKDGQKSLEDQKVALGENKKGHDDVKEGAEGAADGFDTEATAADGLKLSIADLVGQLRDANGLNMSAGEANLHYLDSIDAVQAALEKNGQTLDLSSQKGRDNMQTLYDQADAAQKNADAAYAVDKNYENYGNTLDAARGKLIESALKLGYNADQASAFADQVLRIPTKKQLEIQTNLGPVGAQLETFVTRWNGKQVTIPIVLTASGRTEFINANSNPFGATRLNGGIDYFENGGMRSSAGELAQIRQAGDVTVWAEEGTGGEAFIPFAPSKRARSEAILSTVASMFGGTYVPPNAKPAADGRVSDPMPVSASLGNGQRISGTLRLDMGNAVAYIEGVVDGVLTDVASEYQGGSSL